MVNDGSKDRTEIDDHLTKSLADFAFDFSFGVVVNFFKGRATWVVGDFFKFFCVFGKVSTIEDCFKGFSCVCYTDSSFRHCSLSIFAKSI